MEQETFQGSDPANWEDPFHLHPSHLQTFSENLQDADLVLDIMDLKTKTDCSSLLKLQGPL